MTPGRPVPEPPDPFLDVVDDDGGVDWVEEPLSIPVADVFATDDDDAGTEALEFPASIPGPEPAEVDDDGGTDQFLDTSNSDEFDQRITLPWRTIARIAGQDVPTILSPSMPTSTWRGGPADQAGEIQLIELGTLKLSLVLDIVDGPSTLVLGRDALQGRIRIEV